MKCHYKPNQPDGICSMCKKRQVTWGAVCDECRAKRNERAVNRYNSDPEHRAALQANQIKHRESRTQRSREERIRRIDAGKCVACNKPFDANGTLKCSNCREKQRMYSGASNNALSRKEKYLERREKSQCVDCCSPIQSLSGVRCEDCKLKRKLNQFRRDSGQSETKAYQSHVARRAGLQATSSGTGTATEAPVPGMPGGSPKCVATMSTVPGTKREGL